MVKPTGETTIGVICEQDDPPLDCLVLLDPLANALGNAPELVGKKETAIKSGNLRAQLE